MGINAWAVKVATDIDITGPSVTGPSGTGPSVTGPTPNTAPRLSVPPVPRATPLLPTPPPTVGQSARAASAAMQPATKTASLGMAAGAVLGPALAPKGHRIEGFGRGVGRGLGWDLGGVVGVLAGGGLPGYGAGGYVGDRLARKLMGKPSYDWRGGEHEKVREKDREEGHEKDREAGHEKEKEKEKEKEPTLATKVATAIKHAPSYVMSGKRGKKVMPRPYDRQRKKKKKKQMAAMPRAKTAFSPVSPAMGSTAPVAPDPQTQATSGSLGGLGQDLLQGEDQPGIAAHGFGGQMGQPAAAPRQAPPGGVTSSPIIQRLMAQLGGGEPVRPAGAGTGPLGMGDVSGDLGALGVKTADGAAGSLLSVALPDLSKKLSEMISAYNAPKSDLPPVNMPGTGMPVLSLPQPRTPAPGTPAPSLPKPRTPPATNTPYAPGFGAGRGALAGTALGGLLGAGYGLAAPGEDEEGKQRSRLMEALKRGAVGAGAGALTGGLAGGSVGDGMAGGI